MSWIFFALSAAIIWALANIVDKYVLTKWLKEPMIPVMFLGIIGLISSALIFSFKGIQILSSFNMLLVFVAGTFYILTNSFYFHALRLQERTL